MNILLDLCLLGVGLIVLKLLIPKSGRLEIAAEPELGNPEDPQEDQHNRSGFNAVSIECTDTACAVARALAGTKFLVAEAPVTPLEGCHAPKCSCKYSHHKDRRGAEDRRSLLYFAGDLSEATMAGNQRSNLGRRGSESEQVSDDYDWAQLS